jgi:hypothetical protein
MTIENKLTTAKSAVSNVAYSLRAAWVNAQALRHVLDERTKVLQGAFSAHPNPQPLDIPNSVSHAFNTAREVSGDYVHLKLSLDLIESTDDFKEADKILAPLVSNVRELETQLQAEQFAANRARQDRLDAQAEAEAAAVAKVRAKFAAQEPDLVA